MENASNGKAWRECVTLDYRPGDQDFMTVHKAGNKKDGYVYLIATFAGNTFRDKELTEQERVALITALGGKPKEAADDQ